MNNHQLTNYSKIYKNCYWGNHESGYYNDNSIYNARNSFIDDFKIKSNYIIKGNLYNELNQFDGLDHLEGYISSIDNIRIIVASVYNGSQSQWKITNLLSKGWIIYNKMYSNEDLTLILIIPSHAKKIKHYINYPNLITYVDYLKQKCGDRLQFKITASA